jgi:hypothetical protein
LRGGESGRRHHFFAAGQVGEGHPRYKPPTQEETVQAIQFKTDWLKRQLESFNQHIEEHEK